MRRPSVSNAGIEGLRKGNRLLMLNRGAPCQPVQRRYAAVEAELFGVMSDSRRRLSACVSYM